MKENLLSTNTATGYLIRELSNEEFISYSSLSSLAGVSTGTLINEGGGFLYFYMDNAALVVSKKNIRNNIGWSVLNSAGCITGSKIITIKGSQYRVRALKGADNNPSSAPNGNYVEGTHNSEWSRLFYPIVTDDIYIPSELISPFANYTINDLNMDQALYSWCQETNAVTTTNRVVRGAYHGPSEYATSTIQSVFSYQGWRPCLEKIN